MMLKNYKRLGFGFIILLLAACGDSAPARVLSIATTETATTAAAQVPAATTAAPTARAAANAPRPTPNPNRPPERVAINYSAPDFELPNLEGEKVRLSSFQGKAVLINFWATWCPPCKEELPLLEKTYQSNKDWLEIIGVDVAEEAPLVRLKVREVGMTYTNLLDSNAQVGGQYRAAGLPLSVFLDKEGVIRSIRAGQLNVNSLSESLEKIRG